MLQDENNKLFSDFKVIFLFFDKHLFTYLTILFLQEFLLILFAKVYDNYGFVKKNSDQHHEKHMRNIAIEWACQLHLPDCLNQTKEMFSNAMSDNGINLSVDHKYSIMCSGVINGNDSEYLYLINLYDTITDLSEKQQILRTIGCIENYEILVKFIQLYKEVENAHWLTVIQSVYTNAPIGLKVIMNFLKENVIELHNL